MDCIFCKIANKEIPSKIVFEDDDIIVIMDNKPNVDAHMLIIPKKHYTDYQELDEEISAHIFKVAQKMGKLVQEKTEAKALSLLVNYGDSQVVKHFHMHVLPNFGPVEEKSKQDIDTVFKMLKSDE